MMVCCCYVPAPWSSLVLVLYPRQSFRFLLASNTEEGTMNLLARHRW